MTRELDLFHQLVGGPVRAHELPTRRECPKMTPANDSSAASGPRIYVACLAAYNAGILHGAWIDADQPADDMYAAVREILAASPMPGAEEWAIHDYEGFGPLSLSEWESFERVSAIAQRHCRARSGVRGVAIVRRIPRSRRCRSVRGRVSGRMGFAPRVRRRLGGFDRPLRPR